MELIILGLMTALVIALIDTLEIPEQRELVRVIDSETQRKLEEYNARAGRDD